MFPREGDLRRNLYAKHLEFFRAGEYYKERLFMAANRVGKTVAGAYEMALHLTGRYPDWWLGKRWDRQISAWACGANSQTTRDIVQSQLMALIPPEYVSSTIASRGIANAIETLWVDHVSGRRSKLVYKTYEQGRRSFEGAAIDVVWDDEEPPEDVYAEQLLRTMTTQGIVYTTFTPLLGMSRVIISFLESKSAYKYYVQAGWGDVPHLREADKQSMLAGMPPYQVRARTLGEPSLGAGAIYPIGEDDILIDTFPIPDDWIRSYALDVGWNRTACIWGARDPGSGRIVLYDEHYQGMGEPASHALAIRSRGEWIPGVIDPAARGRSQIDGQQILSMYRQSGLDLMPAVNAVEAGISSVWQALVSGQLKVQRHLSNWRREFGRYHRDDKGHVAKQDDHLMDATRYLWMSGRDRMALMPRPEGYYRPRLLGADGWMA